MRRFAEPTASCVDGHPFRQAVSLGLAIAAIVAAMLISPAAAQYVQQGQKLVGTGSSGFSQQGKSVALSADGNTLLVGADGDNSNLGAAWVFVRNNGGWVQQGGKIAAFNLTGVVGQGYSVALSADSNTALIGGPSYNGQAGAAWVFIRINGEWVEESGALVGTGASGSTPSQGISVALSADGNTALIGGPGDATSTGAAWVWVRSNGVWTQQGPKLTGGVSQLTFGLSVALSADGNTAVIGGDNDNSQVGAAWVFTRSGGTWTQQTKLVGTGGVGSSYQGRSVAISADGNTVLSGGFQDNNAAGAAWVFTRSGNIWTQQGGKLVGTGAAGSAFQGSAVALSGDGNTALIGGPGDDGNFGAIWVFRLAGGVWAQSGSKLVGTGATPTSPDLYQGASVALSADGNTAATGGYLDSANTGSTWVFLRNAGHDFNGNDTADLAWRDSGGATAVWLMNGGSVVSTGGLGAVPTTWSIVGQRDFDGDARADLLWRDSSGNTAIWFLHGTTIASTGFVGNVPTNWSVASTADLDGDGKGDLLWRDTNGNVAAWLMNGAAVSSTGGLGAVPMTWSVVGTADFDGDGKADILWRDTSGNTAIWFLNGTSVASTGFVGNVPTAWSVLGTGDFDGNGKADIVWRDSGGNVALWLMNGASVTSSGGLGTVPTAWSLPLTGDFDGDGKSDLLWNHSSGATSLWFMNGLAIASTGYLGAVAGWTVQGTNTE